MTDYIASRARIHVGARPHPTKYGRFRIARYGRRCVRCLSAATDVSMLRRAIHHAAGYTKFTTDTSRLFILEADTRHPQAWDDITVEDGLRIFLTGGMALPPRVRI